MEAPLLLTVTVAPGLKPCMLGVAVRAMPTTPSTISTIASSPDTKLSRPRI